MSFIKRLRHYPGLYPGKTAATFGFEGANRWLGVELSCQSDNNRGLKVTDHAPKLIAAVFTADIKRRKR